VVEKSIKAYVINMKHPSYIVLESGCKEEPIVFRVIDLAFQFADLIKNYPERARTVAKILVGIGVAVGVVTYFYTR
jgi:hypothetical protein